MKISLIGLHTIESRLDRLLDNYLVFGKSYEDIKAEFPIQRLVGVCASAESSEFKHAFKQMFGRNDSGYICSNGSACVIAALRLAGKTNDCICYSCLSDYNSVQQFMAECPSGGHETEVIVEDSTDNRFTVSTLGSTATRKQLLFSRDRM
jgi:hypothetical protein